MKKADIEMRGLSGLSLGWAAIHKALSNCQELANRGGHSVHVYSKHGVLLFRYESEAS